MHWNKGLPEVHQPQPLLSSPLQTPQQIQPPQSQFLPRVQLPYAIPLPPARHDQILTALPLPPGQRQFPLPQAIPLSPIRRGRNAFQPPGRRVPEPFETELRPPQLPVEGIKEIMRKDEDVHMISSEVPVLFSKACELFICDLTLRAWLHTEDDNRRIIQPSDIFSGIASIENLDFLADMVPRDREIETNDHRSLILESDVNDGVVIPSIVDRGVNDISTIPYAVLASENVGYNGVTAARRGNDTTNVNAGAGSSADVLEQMDAYWAILRYGYMLGRESRYMSDEDDNSNGQ